MGRLPPGWLCLSSGKWGRVDCIIYSVGGGATFMKHFTGGASYKSLGTSALYHYYYHNYLHYLYQTIRLFKRFEAFTHPNYKWRSVSCYLQQQFRAGGRSFEKIFPSWLVQGKFHSKGRIRTRNPAEHHMLYWNRLIELHNVSTVWQQSFVVDIVDSAEITVSNTNLSDIPERKQISEPHSLCSHGKRVEKYPSVY